MLVSSAIYRDNAPEEVAGFSKRKTDAGALGLSACADEWPFCSACPPASDTKLRAAESSVRFKGEASSSFCAFDMET